MATALQLGSLIGKAHLSEQCLTLRILLIVVYAHPIEAYVYASHHILPMMVDVSNSANRKTKTLKTLPSR